VRLIFLERYGENVNISVRYAESLFQNLDQNVSHTFLVREDIQRFAITSEILRFYALSTAITNQIDKMLETI
jgi:hypothetical protein